MRDKPLKGLRVLDLTRLLPGPVCTLHLADLGADVIKVEDTGLGDYARGRGTDDDEMAPVFLAINRNKKSVAINLKEKDGKVIFRRLVKTADVLVESFRPGVMQKLGFEYQSCKEINNRLVYCSISGYGQEGPYKYKAGHDINYIGHAGVLNQIGTAGGDPAIPNLQLGDILGGAVVPAMSILAAVVDARANGVGRYIDVAMTDAVLAHNFQALASVSRGKFPENRGEDFLSGREPCYGVYRTSDDKFIALGALEKKFWDRFCKKIERPDLISCHWENGQYDADWGRAEVRKVFRSQTQQEWLEKFHDEDCCLSPILPFDEAIEDSHLKSRKMIFETDHGDGKRTLQFSAPFKMSDFEVSVEQPAPSHGKHTKELLLELGFEEDDISGFSNANVIKN